MLKKIVKNNPFIFKAVMNVKNFISTKLVSDEEFAKKRYRYFLEEELDLTNPQTFNEKIQWMKVRYRNNLYTQYADKYAVRDIVENKIGKQVLNDLYGVYDDPSDINLDTLPESFVLKATHGSGTNLLVKNKGDLDWQSTKKELSNFLIQNHYYSSREWVYKDIPSKIIIEKYLEVDGRPPNDYKFFCFDGKPIMIQVDKDRFSTHKRNLYDLDWNKLDVKYEFDNSDEIDEKPAKLEEMIEYAEILSEGFPFIRIDFYEVGDQVIFGEATFFPESGKGRFTPEEFNKELGSYLKLPTN